ncbi:cation diffusion facilitator family transporter [Microbacterium sp. LRZ72]|uniref:cation diffusion facilitator family transporter n=1 Tax=Microbacterium sp. LRZ72 TaxID=2942481 RepID=UPI0029A8D204|nr:cation diffusion facilitator family transporter [Microbacterium sp. LRZ72]MDX2377580.1 cation diffusion facilitator family transporter [Microbacterium sp. LRZ72]
MGAGHSHVAGGGTPRNRLLIAFSITSSVFVAEVVGSIITGSLALLVDAAHMLTDMVGLAMALTAAHLMNRAASDRHTWGLRRVEVLSALAQAALLLGVGIFALVEGVRRLFAPPEIASGSLLLFGIIGLVANIASLMVLLNGRKRNLNMRAAFLEVLNDALGSVGVIASAILIATLGWYRSDAVAGILIALLIIPRTFILLRASGRVLLEATPPGLDLGEVRRHILELPEVVAVHDLHASQVSTDLPTLTAHVVVDDTLSPQQSAQLLQELQECVADHFPVSIEHSTFQIEPQSHPGEHTTHA